MEWTSESHQVYLYNLTVSETQLVKKVPLLPERQEFIQQKKANKETRSAGFALFSALFWNNVCTHRPWAWRRSRICCCPLSELGKADEICPAAQSAVN